MTTSTDSPALARVRRELAGSGVHAALASLNARVPHRFTGIYRVDGDVLRNVRLYDRENPALEVGADAPLRETYCSLVRASGAPFAASDTRDDARVAGHPARETTISYCGVPLGDIGTLCHFDLRPQPVPEGEIAFLEIVAPLLLARLRADGLVPDA